MSAIDKLDEARRDKVKKMSDVRLVAKLGQLGFSPEQLETMDRPAMMNAMAQLILTGKDVAPPAAAVTPVQPHCTMSNLKGQNWLGKRNVLRPNRRFAKPKNGE